ncbi:DUF1194 domain-containing protein [Rhizobium sp. TRM95111]|uniref:DUF1194 domain-containing protein n=1 Tax=Rhizobium alarense TaxID=2846851 RepID=UPI001F257B4B|nr:DUF1194 domain-containing protein [Rhizobium alarense]MCF3641220.1 DUF1194 domain-containing protein [Rhizobium alarense]
MRIDALAILTCLAWAAPAPTVAADEEVDVELVLAVDVSGSMDLEEAQIQRDGYVAALTHPDFLTAVQSGLTGRIAITYFEWAGRINPESFTAWQIISTAEEAETFAARLDERPIMTRRGTSISAALTYAVPLFDGNGFAGMRRVIDVSGDGPNNFGAPVTPARDAAIQLGIVVNGLAIMVRPSVAYGALDRYYADCVIGGPGAFVLPVHKREDFAQAIRRKLILEVSGREAPARIVPAAAADCMIGERLRPGLFLDRISPEMQR